ncbi:hypothetical protein [Novipirellula herctigrandis]|uniref:hypothetical protein n=1 Tax=Novipirellula herctigrandis TaxID=2527986 RepID=UPI003AF3B738
MRELVISLKPELVEKPVLNIVVLPFTAHNLQIVSKERRQQVGAGFLELANQAYALNAQSQSPYDPEPDAATNVEHSKNPTNNDSHERRLARLNGIACGTCGGHCCRIGGDTAFLNVSKFQEVLRKQPEAGPADVVAQYMAKIPHETFTDSCIFHGFHGCGLSREQRATTCNVFLCTGLQILKDLVDRDASEMVLAATNIRCGDDLPPKVFRIKTADNDAVIPLLWTATDRDKLEA